MTTDAPEPTPEEDVLPVAAGDWVASLDGTSFQIGKVRQSYRAGGQILIDLVVYDTEGNRVGRVSPAMGGPRTFEPAITYSGGFRRIEPPSFPIRRTMRNEPTDDPAWSRIVYDHHASVVGKPERTVVPKRRRPGNGGGRRRTDFDPELERAALRRAAQELRDLARSQPEAAAALKTRAGALEAEAEGIR